MKEINIAKTLVEKRREKGITQEELAEYIGVSKASVSKWEKAQSYPDITFLPLLAAYFNVSIDELMNYSPQLTKADIRKLYHRLSADFAVKPFDDVIGECREIMKKYYSCFPLLQQMAILLANHHMLAPNMEMKQSILGEAIDLCERVKVESDDVLLAKDATMIAATFYLMKGDPQKVLELTGEEVRPRIQSDELIAHAYQMMGNTQRAKEISQICMYQNLVDMLGIIPSYLMMNIDNQEKVEEIIQRAIAVGEIYHMDSLHANVMAQIYYSAALAYVSLEKAENVLDMLTKYAEVCTNLVPFSLHGDAYFDLMNPWFEDFDLGGGAPRSQSLIAKDILDSVTLNPAFAIVSGDARYKGILLKLNQLGGLK